MLNKFLESLYLKVLVNIVVTHSKSIVYIEMLDKTVVVDTHKTEFSTTKLTPEMYEYILSYTKESPYFYISILDSSIAQGAIPTCSKHNLSLFHDVSSCEYKCYGDKWVYYSEKSDIYDIEKVYEKIGVDFVFSPFVVLANFFKDKVNSTMAMFILVEEKSVSLSVFDNSELLYAQYLDLRKDSVSDELMVDYDDMDSIDLDDEDEEDDSINLDDIDAIDDIDELDDDFGDIADLDNIEEIDEFSEAKDFEEELLEQNEEENYPIHDSEGINEDYQRFLLIQSSINSFYQDTKYKSKFVENIYIADAISGTGDLKRYLEEEMFLNVYIRHVEIAAEVCEIAKLELV